MSGVSRWYEVRPKGLQKPSTFTTSQRATKIFGPLTIFTASDYLIQGSHFYENKRNIWIISLWSQAIRALRWFSMLYCEFLPP
jgi:hypothetical protein